MRLAAVGVLVAGLAACGPAPDRITPDRARLGTDGVVRTLLDAAGSGLRLPAEDLRGVADARRCEDESTVRHQVDASFDVEIDNLATARDDLARALRGTDLEVTESDSDGTRVFEGTTRWTTWTIELGPTEQTISARSECLDVGRVQAVEIAFAERYSVRPGVESPDR